MDTDYPFVQFIGTQRSGSNLLRLMLNQQREIAAPHPPHILKVFMPIVDSYGDLSNETNLKALANDILGLVHHNPVEWSDVPDDADELIEYAPEASLMGLFYGLYKYYIEFKRARMIVCKSMANMYYHKELEEAGLNPKYIHLVRDGRDVACSFRNTMIGPKHAYFAAKKWGEEQTMALELLQELGPQRVLVVRYENLVTDPESILQEVCKYLGHPFRASMLRYYESDASRRAATAGKMWQNLTKPVLKNNVGKYWHEFGAGEAELFESVAGDMLAHHGYPIEGTPAEPGTFTDAMIDEFAKEDAKMQQAAMDAADPEDREKRLRYNAYIDKLNKKAKK